MNFQKIFLSGLIAGIVGFFAAYLVYGVVTADFFMKHPGTDAGAMRSMKDMIWWAIIAGSLLWGFAYAYIYSLAGINSAGRGASAGFMIGLLINAAADLIIYADTNIASLHSTAADIACGAVMGAITGAVVGWVNGMMSKKAAA